MMDTGDLFRTPAPADKKPEQAMTPNGPVRPGDRVRLAPRRTVDVFDMALSGRTAVVEAIEQDMEDRVYVAVVVEDDPGRELGEMRQPAHRFFFRPEEVQPLGQGEEEPHE